MTRQPSTRPSPRFGVRAEDGTLVVEGVVTLDDVPALLCALDRAQGAARVSLGGAAHTDASVVAALARWAHQRQGRALVGGRADVERMVELFADSAAREVPVERRPGALETIGRQVAGAADEARSMLTFFGELLATAWRVLRRPSLLRWRDVMPLVERAGADGLLIVGLMTLLLGVVMGYQGAIQLQRFGAASYTPRLVGIGAVRELTPLMTAIVVAGRSGAAFAAEIGTMKVSQEIDALRALGFAPHSFLVLPRCIALAICVPILTLIADVVSILGALAVVVLVLDTTPLEFLVGSREAIEAGDVLVGLIKSVAYAQAIALAACHHGLRTSGGAEGVGRRTTATVVSALVLIVVIDAVLTIVAYEVGL